MMQHSRSRRGFALIAVIGVLTVLIFYLAAVQGSVSQTVHQDDTGRGRMEHAEALAAMAGIVSPVDTATTITITSTAEKPIITDMAFSAQVGVRPLAAADEAWASMPGMRQRPGDMLLNIRWTGGPAAGTVDRVLINTQSRRRGMVRLAAQSITR